MSHIIAIPRTHAGQLYMGYKFFKQYDRLMEYVHSILILKQPEIYINTISITMVCRLNLLGDMLILNKCVMEL